MSAVVKTATPFIDLECLCEALKSIGCGYRVQGNKIITDRQDLSLGFQEFNKNNVGVWILSAYSHIDRNQTEFIKQVEAKYNEICPQMLQDLKDKLEAIKNIKNYSNEASLLKREINRIEMELHEFIEKQKTTIIARAKEQGYSIKEEKIKGKIKLVLVKNTY